MGRDERRGQKNVKMGERNGERERRVGRCGDEGISTMEEERQFVGQSIVRVTFRGDGGRPPR